MNNVILNTSSLHFQDIFMHTQLAYKHKIFLDTLYILTFASFENISGPLFRILWELISLKERGVSDQCQYLGSKYRC